MGIQRDRKASARQELLRLRRLLSAADRKAADCHIQEAIVNYAAAFCAQRTVDDAQGTPTIALYRSIRGEVDVWPCAIGLWQQGWRVVVPKTTTSAGVLSFVTVHADAQWAPGPYGILEPVAGSASGSNGDGTEIQAAEIAVYIVPGLGFTLAGVRLGYGGGYYDCWFDQTGALGQRVGAAYGCQVVGDLPIEAHDVRMDALVTEQGVSQCIPGR